MAKRGYNVQLFVILAILFSLLFLSNALVPLASAQTPVRTSAAGYYGKTSAGLTAVTADVVIPTVTCQPKLSEGQDLQIGVPLSGGRPSAHPSSYRSQSSSS
jgi:hypothetical protein